MVAKLTPVPKETVTLLLCSNCAYWVRGFRGDATSGFPWHGTSPLGDCRASLPSAGPKNFGKTHEDDWCKFHSPA